MRFEFCLDFVIWSLEFIFMVILNINKYFFIRGGAERFFFELAQMLEKKGNKVVPLAMQHKKNQSSEYEKYFISQVQTEKITFSWQGVRTVVRFFWSFETKRQLKKIIKQEKPGLAIVHNIYHQISPSILPVLKKNKIPVILVAHDYGLLSPNYNMFVRGKVYDKICGSGWLKCILDRCVKNSLIQSVVSALETWLHHGVLNVYKKNIDLVICPSKFMAQMYLKAGWPKNKVVHLPYFVKTKEQRNRGTKELFYKKYILYFGRLSDEKGVDVLLRAMQDLPNVKLKIVGEGPEKLKLKTQLTKGKINNAEFLGYKSGQELNKLIQNAKFIVVPSKWYENYPLSLLEAYNLGVPAVVSNMGGLPEMIPDKDDGFIFKSGDEHELAKKIHDLWHDERVLFEAGEKVRKYILDNNDKDKYYQGLMGIYGKLE